MEGYITLGLGEIYLTCWRCGCYLGMARPGVAVICPYCSRITTAQKAVYTEAADKTP